MHTLVTFLGKGRHNLQSGYRSTIYQFDDTRRETAFFGIALLDHLKPDALVVLGTRGRMCGVLVEHLAVEGQDEDLRLAFLQTESAGLVDEDLLRSVAPLMRRALGIDARPRLIPYARRCRAAGHSRNDLGLCSVGEVTFDLTHGFRHLGMRKPAAEALEAEFKSGKHEQRKRDAYWMLKNVRNALAHGNRRDDDRFSKPRGSARSMHGELESCFNRLLG